MQLNKILGLCHKIRLASVLITLFYLSYGVIKVNATTKNILGDTSYVYLDSIIVKSRMLQKHKLNLPYSLVQKNIEAIKLGNYRTTPEALMGSSGVFIQKTNQFKTIP